MYYGNASATTEPLANSTYGSQNVWQSTGDTSTAMVQHMKDATTSTIIDSTAYANNGTKKAANEPIATPSGQIDGAQTFDGTDDYVDVGNGASLNITNAITVEVWIKLSSNTEPHMIIYKGSGAPNYPGYDLYYSSGLFIFKGTNKTPATYAQASSLNALGNWTHIVGTMDGHNISIYRDGILKQTVTDLNQFLDSNTNDVIIGKRWRSSAPGEVNDWFFSGSIDEARIYNRALSAQEITTQYNNQYSPSTFYALGSEESLDHLVITGSSPQTSGSSQTITITAKTNLGNTYTDYAGDKSPTFSGANAYSGGSSPTCSDKTGADIALGTATTLTFTNGVATCTLKLYKVESASIQYLRIVLSFSMKSTDIGYRLG
jgi:hypothetical protein